MICRELWQLIGHSTFSVVPVRVSSAKAVVVGGGGDRFALPESPGREQVSSTVRCMDHWDEVNSGNEYVDD